MSTSSPFGKSVHFRNKHHSNLNSATYQLGLEQGTCLTNLNWNSGAIITTLQGLRSSEQHLPPWVQISVLTTVDSLTLDWPWRRHWNTMSLSAFSLVNRDELHLFHSRITNVTDQCKTLTPMPWPLRPHIPSSELAAFPVLELPPLYTLCSPLSRYDLSPPSDAPPLMERL